MSLGNGLGHPISGARNAPSIFSLRTAPRPAYSSSGTARRDQSPARRTPPGDGAISVATPAAAPVASQWPANGPPMARRTLDSEARQVIPYPEPSNQDPRGQPSQGQPPRGEPHPQGRPSQGQALNGDRVRRGTVLLVRDGSQPADAGGTDGLYAPPYHRKWDRMHRSPPFPETRPSLLLSLRGGQPVQSAWREFFARYGPPIYRVARRRGLDGPDADEIVQQVMIAVSAHIDGFRYDRDRGRFRHWVSRIAGNKIRDLIRRRKATHKEGSFDEGRDSPAVGEMLTDDWEREWRVQDLLWCVEQVRGDFSPRRFEAFKLYVLDGVSAAETARRLGMSVGHVYVTRTHVVKRIRQSMEKLGEDGTRLET